MKSERAMKKIKALGWTGRRAGYRIVSCAAASDAVELAEEDAETRTRAEDRERAVRAFQRWCPEHEDGKCVDSSHDTVDCLAANCVSCEEFLKHYDNEQ
jgi:hypothetical protein